MRWRSTGFAKSIGDAGDGFVHCFDAKRYVILSGNQMLIELGVGPADEQRAVQRTIPRAHAWAVRRKCMRFSASLPRLRSSWG